MFFLKPQFYHIDLTSVYFEKFIKPFSEAKLRGNELNIHFLVSQ